MPENSIKKIFHISDLHYGEDTSNWEDHWDQLTSHIIASVNSKRTSAVIVIITGDMLDNPIQNHFVKFGELLQSFYNELIEHIDNECPAYIITVPGNHDRYYYGNDITIVRYKNKLFDKNGHKFLLPFKKKPYQERLKELCLEIYEKTQLALFPIDSTSIHDRWSKKIPQFAQGYVKRPNKQIKTFDDLYKSIGGIPLVKIAFMHHHPLPLAISHKDQALEKFMVLKNAVQVTNVLANSNIDFILHGHHHKSALYSIKNLMLSDSLKYLCVSACANSISFKGKPSEYKSLEINQQSCMLETFQRNISDDFQFRSMAKKDLYEFVFNKATFSCSAINQDIKFISSKSKCVRVRDDGSASVVTSWENIELKPGIEKYSLNEDLKIGPGRVESIFTAESVDPHLDNIEYIERDLRCISQHNNDLQEYFAPEYQNNNIDVGTKSLSIQYEAANMYANNQVENEDIYGYLESAENLEKSQRSYEYVTISSKYNTAKYELVLQFAELSLAPLSSEVDVVVWNLKETCDSDYKNPIRPDSDNYRELESEMKNDNKISLRKTDQFGLFILTVNNPIPHVYYSLRWKLRPTLNPQQLNRLKLFREKFAGYVINNDLSKLKSISRIFAAYSNMISVAIKNKNNTKEYNLEEFYDKDHFQLSVHYFNKNGLLHSLKGNGDRGLSIIVGRGVVGRAYRRCAPILWSKKYLEDDFGLEGTGLIPEIQKIQGNKPLSFLASFPIIFNQDNKNIVGLCSFYSSTLQKDHIFLADPGNDAIKLILTRISNELHEQWYDTFSKDW